MSTIVRRKTANGFMPVELDCAGEIQDFRPLGEVYEYAWVDLTRGHLPALGSCGAGRHEATSEGPFGITVWGIDYSSSYGYAAGMGNQPLTQVEAPVR